MDTRQLEYFAAVARTSSFSRAAQEQFVTQTTVSYHISLLEKELGVKLLERDNKTVTLTPAGEAYLAKAQVILHELDDARDEARLIQHGQQEDLRIGYFGRSCYELLPSLLETLHVRHPDIHLTVHQDCQSELVHMLQAGELDCVFCTDYGMFSQLTWIEKMCVFADPIQLLVRADHWAADRSSVRTEELAGERLVLYVEKRLWEKGDQGAAQAPIDCASVQYVDSHDDLVLMVRSGYAVSMGARRALTCEFDNLKLIPIEDYHQFDNNYLCWSRGVQKEVLNDLIQILQSSFAFE